MGWRGVFSERRHSSCSSCALFRKSGQAMVWWHVLTSCGFLLPAYLWSDAPLWTGHPHTYQCQLSPLAAGRRRGHGVWNQQGRPAYLPPRVSDAYRVWLTHLEFILCIRPASERRGYIATSSLIGWAHTQNDPCTLRQIKWPTFSNAFSWMKVIVKESKFHWIFFVKVQLTICPYWCK